MLNRLLPTLTFLLVLAIADSAQAQSAKLPKGLSVRLDTFTGDTIYSTDYGRLDQPNGCGRLNLAIIFDLARGPSGQVEFLTYKYFDPGDPFSRGNFIGGHAAFLNIDGDIFEVKDTRATPRLSSDGGMKSEDASFLLPDSTLARIANAKDARVRIIGTQKTCDGVIERNLRNRLAMLFGYLERSR